MMDPRLIGTWEESAGGDRAVVSLATDNSYVIEYTSDGKAVRFEARLGRLGEFLVLDVWPSPRDDELPRPYADLLIAGHLLFAVDIGPDEIRVATLEPDSLAAALSAGMVTLVTSDPDDQMILHGTTEDLRAALGPYLGRLGAFAEADIWLRSLDIKAVEPVTVPCFDAEPWPEADQLFHRDPHWVGGDGASSVDLGDGRILWLFGDSWIDPAGTSARQGGHMVSNSVAIQTGKDPRDASIQFYWGRASDRSPAAFIPDQTDERYWFGNGVVVADRLILFLNRVRRTNSGLGFESVGWTAWMVDNPEVEPSSWHMHQLETPTNPMGVLVGFATVLQMGKHVYAFGSADPVQSHPIYAVRWPTEQVRNGNLALPEWWGRRTSRLGV